MITLRQTLRGRIRDLIVGVSIVFTSPIWLHARIGLWLHSEAAFLAWGQFLSFIPGLTGVMLRRGYYRMCLEDLATDVGIGFGTWFSHPQARVASGVDIGARCIIGMCEIGEHTLIGSHVNVLSGRRQHGLPCQESPAATQNGSFDKIHIGANGWIGCGSIIMADVGLGTVIGAGSIVVKAIPARVTAVGNPCVPKRVPQITPPSHALAVCR